MIRRPPRSTLDRSSAASDVYKRQTQEDAVRQRFPADPPAEVDRGGAAGRLQGRCPAPVSYTHLRAHETVLDLVCRLLLEKNNMSATKLHQANSINNGNILYADTHIGYKTQYILENT